MIPALIRLASASKGIASGAKNMGLVGGDFPVRVSLLMFVFMLSFAGTMELLQVFVTFIGTVIPPFVLVSSVISAFANFVLFICFSVVCDVPYFEGKQAITKATLLLAGTTADITPYIGAFPIIVGGVVAMFLISRKEDADRAAATAAQPA